MRNANKSPKIPYFAMAREWKSDRNPYPGLDWITIKS